MKTNVEYYRDIFFGVLWNSTCCLTHIWHQNQSITTQRSKKIMSENYIEIIFSLMSNETENKNALSNNLKSFYDDYSPSEKKIVDNIVISICGYSLDTIIYHAEKIIWEKKN